MASQVSEAVHPPTYHVLLIGVDAYQARPLGGCVNDIDAVQRLLLGPRMAIARERIRRLASPRPALPSQARADHGAAVAEEPATLANLRAALADLASDRVVPNDRVFIYYAGHGARVEVRFARARTYHCEALVMADHDPARPGSGMLFDYELAEALRAISERTSSIVLVLDCCHAAGVTRGPGELFPAEVLASTEPIARCLELDRVAEVPDPYPALPGATEFPRPLIAAADHCHVVAACLGHERANEERGPDGVRHGLLTRAFVAAIEDTADIALPELTWGWIWQRVCAEVSQCNPAQHPRMAGNAGRAVFSGPPVEHDPGIPISRVGDAFQIGAGTLANITKGAVLAIYGDQPPYFPLLDSAEDHRVRIGLVRVDGAKLATATAVAEGRAFVLPRGARGRLIEAGDAARVRCAVIPSNRELESRLRESPLLELVSETEGPEVRLEYSRGRWFLTDSLYSTRPDRPILFALHPNELDCARRVVEHYCAYSLPLRMAARLTDLPGSLDLRVRIPPDPRAIPANVMPGANSQQIAATTSDTYVLRVGARVCFEVRNHSPHRLRVTLVNSAASGKVQFLGDCIIDAETFHTFYANTSEAAFEMVLPPGLDHGLDRVCVIGRTTHAHDLGYLRVDRTFADAVNVTRSIGRSFDAGAHARPKTPPIEQWTVAEAIIETRR